MRVTCRRAPDGPKAGKRDSGTDRQGRTHIEWMSESNQHNKKVDRPVVMVVEDDESTAELLLHFLHREGYETWYAADGFAAQKLVQENNAPVLAILDIMLPYKDGISLVQQIRAKIGWESVPIIMLTAKSDEQDVVKALDSGATDYVVKPFQPKALMARIRRLVEPDA